MNELDGKLNMTQSNISHDGNYNSIVKTPKNEINQKQFQNNYNNPINNNSIHQIKEINNQLINQIPNIENIPNTQKQNSKSKKDNQRFNIIIRIRPKVPNDSVELTTEEELKPCIFKTQSNKILLRNEKTDNDYEMTFDQVFNEKSTQESLYYSFGEKLVKDVFRGYNGTIMAYGQTGSGKSYTIFGKSLIESDKQTYTINQGIVQRAIHQIFEYKALNKGKKNVSVFISFMQVYLNQITDLLDEKNGDVIFNADKPQFKIGKDNTVFSSKKPIINTDFFNMLSINANQRYSYYETERLVESEFEGDFQIIDTYRCDDLIYISEDQEGVQVIKSEEKFKEITKKIEENIIDFRTDLAKFLDSYKVNFSGVVEKAFIPLKKKNASFEKIKNSINNIINELENSKIILKKRDLQFLTEYPLGNLPENKELEVEIVKGQEKVGYLYFKISPEEKVFETKSPIQNMYFINLLNIAKYKYLREKGKNHKFINFINEEGEAATLQKEEDIKRVSEQIGNLRKYKIPEKSLNENKDKHKLNNYKDSNKADDK